MTAVILRKSVCLWTPKAPGRPSTVMQPKKGPSVTTTSMRVRQARSDSTQTQQLFWKDLKLALFFSETSAHLSSQSSSSCPKSDDHFTWVLFKDHCYAFNMYNYSVFTMESAKNVCQKLGECTYPELLSCKFHLWSHPIGSLDRKKQYTCSQPQFVLLYMPFRGIFEIHVTMIIENFLLQNFVIFCAISIRWWEKQF